MRRRISGRRIWLCLVGVVVCCHSFARAEVPYGVGDWPAAGRGNHRAVVVVDSDAKAVRVRIPWRRRDANPAGKQIRVFDFKTDKPIRNVLPLRVENEAGEIVFEPTSGPGQYAVYWLPYNPPKGAFTDPGTYFPAKLTAEADWLAGKGLQADPPDVTGKALPEAAVKVIQARTDMDRMDPMSLIATAGEIDAILAANPTAKYMLFPEDRTRGVEMSHTIPGLWARRGACTPFIDQAQPGEYYCYQIGVWACREAIQNLSLEFGPLTGPDGGVIAADRMTCFTLGGIDRQGQPFTKPFRLGKGRVRALWIGIDVPAYAAGTYRGTVTVRPDGLAPREVGITLEIAGPVLPDGGVKDGYRLARLKWLNSTLNLDHEVAEPFTPIRQDGSTYHILDRTITLGPLGLPEQVTSRGRAILAGPMTLAVQSQAGTIAFEPTGEVETLRAVPDLIERVYRSSGEGIERTTRVVLEADGCVEFWTTLRASRDMKLQDVRLVAPYRPEVGRFFMGLGRQGGFCPEVVRWAWDLDRATHDAWLGDATAGMQIRLQPENPSYSMLDFRSEPPPASWYNGGLGGAIVEKRDGCIEYRAWSGRRTFKAGEELTFRTRLIVTPAKPVDYKNMWRVRLGPSATHTVQHVHHGHPGVNPYINYPFAHWQGLRDFIADARQRQGRIGCNVYYTTRELTNHCPEIFAFRSLGNEIYRTDSSLVYAADQAEIRTATGGGYPWLVEHLGDNYIPGWIVSMQGEVCAGIATHAGRLDNFYVAGLKFLIEQTGMDGLYLDGLAYDRLTMQRVAKTMQRNLDRYRINLHVGNEYATADRRRNAMNSTMEHLPYITSLWAGEGIDYNMPPDYWLVEISGLPFGVYSEMLNYGNGGNQWRGMVFGMDGRFNPAKEPLWRFWDAYEIQKTEMVGWWEPTCPVRPTNKEIYATVYRKEGSALIALASWARTDAETRLEIDFKALGLPADGCVLRAPKIPAFQDEAATFRTDQPIPVKQGRGWLLIVEPQTTSAGGAGK